MCQEEGDPEDGFSLSLNVSAAVNDPDLTETVCCCEFVLLVVHTTSVCVWVGPARDQTTNQYSVAMTTPAVTVAVVWCLFKTS